MQGNSGLDPDLGGGKRPWFGAKRFGYGYRPQTWQGWATMAVLAGFLITVASVTHGHSPLMVVAIVLVVGVPLLIIGVQRR
jgi:hypothetical protein